MAEPKDSTNTWGVQNDNGDAKVNVKVGHNRTTNETVTEFIVSDKNSKEHHHIGINEQGDQVFHTTKKD